MNKTPLKVLVIDRALKDGEHPVTDIFNVYVKQKFDLVLFPFSEKKRVNEMIVLNRSIMRSWDWERLFSVEVEIAEDPWFYDFDVPEVEEETIYDILDKEFDVETIKLTDAEKAKV